MYLCHLHVIMAGMPKQAAKLMQELPLPEDCRLHLQQKDSLLSFKEHAIHKCTAVLLRDEAAWTSAQIDAIFGADAFLVFCTAQPEKLTEEQLARIQALWPLPMTDRLLSFHCQRLLAALHLHQKLWHTGNCLQTVVDTMPGFVWFKDLAGHHLKVNQAFCEMVGKSMQEVEGRQHYEIWGISPEQYAEGEYVCLETDAAIAANPKPTLFQEQVLHSKLGLRQLETYKAPIFDEDGKLIGNIGVAKDVTDEYANKERILLLSRTDELTRLANRRYFYQFVEKHRQHCNGALTLCYIDLDHFKQLNDTFGHQYGDAALMAMGELLKQAFPKDFIARLGGDEFVVAVFAVPDRESLQHKLDNLYQAARDFFRKDESFRNLDMSIGVALTDSAAVSLDTLLQRSDDALYYSKEHCRGHYTFYEDIREKLVPRRGNGEKHE
ncbi:MAG: GGDEF domain-containing protein [Selenomonas sp.]|uniref:sensor domain-containing diguanylate cyclase n=1 Tax=Selenomonas sp. TaxID=2053611 RepID=UPI0025E4452D|nr:GGDEF domain-containing protein [Selenomonas sp.]MCR5757582.1 GGDEF domain-containing protein [Selenomonas sp.]